MPFRYAHKTTTGSCGEWFHIQNTIMTAKYIMIYIYVGTTAANKKGFDYKVTSLKCNTRRWRHKPQSLLRQIIHNYHWITNIINISFPVYIVLLTLGNFLALKSSTSLQKSIFSSPCCVSKNCYVKKKESYKWHCNKLYLTSNWW